MISKVEALARELHKDQVDKAGVPYVHHLERVAANFAPDSPEHEVAWLHDSIEDTPATLEYLRQCGISWPALAAINAITRQSGEDYEDYIDRVGGNELARRVKLADLRDNLDPARGWPEAESLRRRYRRAWRELKADE